MDFSKEVEVFFDSYNLDENRSILTALNYVNQHILASEWDDIKEKF